MVSISKNRQLINASHDTFISYSFFVTVEMASVSKSVGQGDTCDENIEQKSDTNQKQYNAVLSITTNQRNSYVAPT